MVPVVVLEKPITPPVVVADKEVVTRVKSTLNLQGIFNNKPSLEVKSKSEGQEKLSNRKLSLLEVQKAWNEFAESRKNQVAEYNLMLREFNLAGSTIQLQLTNPVEEPLLAGIKTDLLTFLKEKLNCEISIEGVLQKSTLKKIIYTNKEKFDHLVEKNPMLLELKEKFGLDTDY